jgi:hypothetical protein
MNRVVRLAEIADEAEAEIMPHDEVSLLSDPPQAAEINPEYLRMVEAL